MNPARHDPIQHRLVVEGAKTSHGDHYPACRVGKDVTQFVLPVEEVKRDRDRADPGDREFHGDELRVIRHDHGDPIAGANTECNKTVGQPPGLGCHVRVAKLRVVAQHDGAAAIPAGAGVKPTGKRLGSPHREALAKCLSSRLDVGVNGPARTMLGALLSHRIGAELPFDMSLISVQRLVISSRLGGSPNMTPSF